MTPVLTVGAESTARLVAITVADYRAHERLLARQRRARALRRGRLRARSNAMAHLSSQARAQAAVFRVMSIVEAHTADEIVSRLASEFPEPRSAAKSEAYLATEDAATRTWNDLKVRLTDWFGLVVADCASWADMMALVQVRNAVAHGSGELTRRQLRTDTSKYEAMFKPLDVALDGTRLVLGLNAVDNCHDRAATYLAWLDKGLQGFDAK